TRTSWPAARAGRASTTARTSDSQRRLAWYPRYILVLTPMYRGPAGALVPEVRLMDLLQGGVEAGSGLVQQLVGLVAEPLGGKHHRSRHEGQHAQGVDTHGPGGRVGCLIDGRPQDRGDEAAEVAE